VVSFVKLKDPAIIHNVVLVVVVAAIDSCTETRVNKATQAKDNADTTVFLFSFFIDKQ
jgi:hypothetical protein